MVDSVLGIWAHPDDEAFVAGGLMAAAARSGVRVVCAHATAGEKGLHHGAPMERGLLGATRRAELRDALAILGVDRQIQGDYGDARLEEVSAEEGTSWVTSLLDDVRPDVVVTFGPDGFTGHPDHRVLSGWITRALSRYLRPPVVLHCVTTAGWRDRFVPPLQEFDAFWPGYPVVIDQADPDYVFSLDASLVATKLKALRAHTSQMTRFFDAFGDRFMTDLVSTECFMVAPEGTAPAASPPSVLRPGRLSGSRRTEPAG